MSCHRTVSVLILGSLPLLGACEQKPATRADGAPPATTSSNGAATKTATGQNADGTPSRAPTKPASKPADTGGDAKTPMDQSEDSTHIKTTASIRRAIMNDDTMSMNAKNCKIITDETGTVTLRGEVNSEAERAAIERYATAAAGGKRVINELEVRPSE